MLNETIVIATPITKTIQREVVVAFHIGDHAVAKIRRDPIIKPPVASMLNSPFKIVRMAFCRRKKVNLDA